MSTKTLIEKYYQFFNQGDMESFYNLLDEQVIHDINQGGRQVGKKEFRHFMDHMNRCYAEKIKDLVIMTNPEGTRAGAEFIVEGTYLKTDKGLPEARGQVYSIPVATLFETKAGKISRVTTYYNLQHWLKSVQ